MVNKVILVGNVGRDPELRYTASGTAVANFSLATSRRVKRNEQWESETEWHRVVAWARTAEVVNQYAPKGKQLFIEGRLQTRQWEDREGNTRYTTEVVAESIQLLGRRGDEAGGDFGGGGGDRTGEPSAQGGGGGGQSQVTDDDIPF